MSPTSVVFHAGGWIALSGQPSSPPSNLAPTAPASLSVIATSSTAASVTWDAATDPDGTVASYDVMVNGVIVQTVTTLAASLTGLVAATTYSIAVRATDNDGAMGPAVSTSFTMTAPEDTGYPDATTTGVAPGTTLSTGWFHNSFYGSPTGAVIEGRAIVCDSSLEHPTSDNGKTITYRNCRFTGGAYWLVWNNDNPVHLIFEHCTFIGGGDASLAASNVTLRYCDISGGGDGLKIGSAVVIENSFIHDLVVTPTSHNDCIQSLGTAGTGAEGSGLRITHSTLDGSNGEFCMTMSTGSASEMRDILVEDTLLLYQGNIAISGGYQNGTDSPSKVSNVIYRNNKIKAGSGLPVFTAVDSPVVVTGTTWLDGPNAGQPI